MLSSDLISSTVRVILPSRRHIDPSFMVGQIDCGSLPGFLLKIKRTATDNARVTAGAPPPHFFLPGRRQASH
jgi:hypothetical protein